MKADPAGNTLAQLDPHVFYPVGNLTNNYFEIELIGRFIEQEEGPVTGAKVICNGLHDFLQNFPAIKARGKSFTNLIVYINFFLEALKAFFYQLIIHSRILIGTKDEFLRIFPELPFENRNYKQSPAI